MGRGLNQKETTVLKNTIRRLSKMCDSPTLYVGHTTPIEWAILLLEDALQEGGDLSHPLMNFQLMMRARSAETALKWDEASELLEVLNKRKKAIHEAVAKGEFQ